MFNRKTAKQTENVQDALRMQMSDGMMLLC